MNLSLKKRPGTTILGIAIERDRLEVVELRRTNGSSEIRRSVSVPLPADALATEPEALGQTLRTHLEEAGIRETRCAVSLPPHAASTLTVAVPDLPDADRRSFLDLEAERGFAHNPENLLVRTSVVALPEPTQPYATLVAFETRTIQRIEAWLRAARLRPVSFSLGLDALRPRKSDGPGIVLDLYPSGPQLQIHILAGQGTLALRVVEDAFLPAADSKDLHPDLDLILRELRITLGQLPTDIRDHLSVARILGPSDQARDFAESMRTRLGAQGLRVEHVADLRLDDLPFRAPTQSPASPALAVALMTAAGKTPSLDFLPPRVSAWHQFTARHSSKRVVWASAAAGVVVGLIGLIFLGQQLLLWRWQSRWDAMKAKVTQLEGMQREVRRYEPWFDPSVRSLSILRRLTESFPEDGSVSAKSIEIRSPSRVACTGTARDPQAWLRMLDTIRNAPGVSDLQVEQVRGKSPIEFSFHFQWQPRSRS